MKILKWVLIYLGIFATVYGASLLSYYTGYRWFGVAGGSSVVTNVDSVVIRNEQINQEYIIKQKTHEINWIRDSARIIFLPDSELIPTADSLSNILLGQ